MIKFSKFDLRKRDMNVGVVNFLLIKFFRLLAFCFGFGILCFLILKFLVFPVNKGYKDLLENYLLLISCVMAISSYLMAKLIEKFCFLYHSEKSFKFAVKNLIVGNPIKLLILAISLICLSVIEYRNFTGYCYKKGRYLTEQELIDAVIEKKFVNTEARYNSHCGSNGCKRVPVIVYSSVQDFKEKNHDCCHVKYDSWYTEGPFWSFIGKIFNSYYLLGLDIYSMKEIYDEQVTYEVDSYSVTSCGKPYLVGGMTLNKEEYFSKRY